MSHNKRKSISISFIVLFLFQIWMPSVSFALTDGPGQPEVSSFAPIGMNDMVDLFSGDFSYNIPLMNVPGPDGGYPINIHYNSAVGMEQEASWVGLGWNLNLGSVSRTMKGIPDDFNGTPIRKQINYKTNTSVGLEIAPETEIASAEGCIPVNGLSIGVLYDNQNGMGTTAGFSSSSLKGVPIGLDFKFNSTRGLNFNVSYSGSLFKKKAGFNLGASMNSRNGLQKINYSLSTNGIFGRFKVKSTEWSLHRGGIGLGSSPISYIPTAQVGTRTLNGKIGVKTGGNLTFLSVKGDLGGEVSRTYVKDEYKDKTYSSFGYWNTQEADYHNSGDGKTDELLDFNLESQGNVSQFTPFGENVNPTPDSFYASAQGFGGNFESYRTEHGYYYSPAVKSSNMGGVFTSDFGAGNLDLGTEVGASYSESYSGPIRGDRFNPKGELDFDDNSEFNQFVYLKDYSSFNAVQSNAHYMNNDELYQFKIRQGLNAQVYNRLSEGYVYSHDANISTVSSKARENSNAVLQPILVKDMSSDLIREIGMFNIINEHPYSDSAGPTETLDYIKEVESEFADRFEDYDNNNQVGAFIGINENGMRYEYGLPVYNNYQKEAVFSMPDTENTNGDKVVDYIWDSSNDPNPNSIDNNYGSSHYYSSDELPPYAYAHMLTGVYSSDYVDLTGDGPSEDDLGYYVKYNYTKTSDNYKWRIPYEGVNFMENNLTDDQFEIFGSNDVGDDMGNIQFGSKEIVYVNSIETKTHIAEFIISPRKDGRAAEGMDVSFGGTIFSNDTETDMLYRLDRINLYAKNLESSTPIQSVIFTYDNSLCQQVSNNEEIYDQLSTERGKLTLKSIHTEYYGSNKGELSPYEFTYETGDQTFNYLPKNIDNWGNFEERSNTDLYYGLKSFNPYTDQRFDLDQDGDSDEDDIALRNELSSAWSLKNIRLPSGGDISIDYEADTYAYVQNEKAEQMFRVLGSKGFNVDGLRGMSSVADSDYDLLNVLDETDSSNDDGIYWLQVLLPLDNAASLDQAQQYWDKSIEGIEDFYFKVFMELKKTPGKQGRLKDYVKGYAKVALDQMSFSDVYQTDDNYFVAKLPVVSDHHKEIHPFKLQGLNDLRYTRGDLFVNHTAGGTITQALGIIPETMALITGYLNMSILRGWCKNADFNNPEYKSFVRLKNGNGKKYGGGHRVKKLTISDNWQELTGNSNQENSSFYEVNYKYENPDGTSSGVATYESSIGGDENALVKSTRYKADKFTNAKNLFMEYPNNEALFPSASVGYGRVVVTSSGGINTQGQDLYPGTTELPIDQRLESPQIVHEFYTFKDFPIESNHTQLKRKKQFPPKIIIPCWGSMTFNNSITSQGYSIKLNDMHGKQKSVKTYSSTVNVNSDIQPYAKTEFKYQKVGNQLDSHVDFYNPNTGIEEHVEMGKSVEVASYMNENRSIGSSNDAIDVDLTFIGFPIPTFILKSDYFEGHSRTVTTNKIIRQQGILEKVITKIGDSSSESETLAFDRITGQSVVTVKTNNFDKPIYVMNIPAHWEYEDFMPIHERIDASFDTFFASTSYGNTIITLEPLDNIYKAGDLIRVNANNQSLLTTITNVVGNTMTVAHDSSITIEEHILGDETIGVQIVKPVEKNLISTQIGSVVTLTNPLELPLETSSWLGDLNNGIQSAYAWYNTANEQFYCSGQIDDKITGQPRGYCGEFETNDACGNEFLGSVKIWPGDTWSLEIDLVCSDSDCTVPPVSFSIELPNSGNGTDNWHDFSQSELIINNQGLFQMVEQNIDTNDENLSGVDLNSVDAESIDELMNFECAKEVIFADAITLSDNWDYVYDHNYFDEAFGTNDAQVIQEIINANPYRYGKKGNYRLKESFSFQAPRLQGDETDVSVDGEFTYYPFRWCDENYNELCDIEALNNHWTKGSQITKYDPFNNGLEEVNAIGVHSSVLYSRDKNFVEATAANAKNQEIAFENFEYTSNYSPGGNFNFNGAGNINADISHSGGQSLELSPGESISIQFNENAVSTGLFTPFLENDWYESPELSKTYLLSFWVRTYMSAAEIVQIIGESQEAIDIYSDEISIEGWKKVDVEVLFQNGDVFDITLNNSSGVEMYLDDIRLHPFKAGFVSHVYDFELSRHLATLDNRNYAVFYNYDEEGALTQVKKETVRGVRTIQSSRSNTVK